MDLSTKLKITGYADGGADGGGVGRAGPGLRKARIKTGCPFRTPPCTGHGC